MATDIFTIDSSRKAPRISVNKLGEYMTATPLRRRRIIQDQTRPKAFIFPRYSEAQSAITRYLTAERQDESLLLSEIERLSLAPSATEWEEQRKRLCVEALERFLEVAESLELGGLSATAAGSDPRRLTIGGLEVSVRPEVLLHGLNRLKQPVAGAIKLYFAKSFPLSADGGEYVATAVHEYLESSGHHERADPRLCEVIDVFGRRVFHAPRAVARRRKDLAAACEEIVRAWEAV